MEKGRGSILALLLQLLLLHALLASEDDNNKTSWCASFAMADATECTDKAWAGILKDMFSPDDTCPNSIRYVDAFQQLSQPLVALQVSASRTEEPGCNTTWGKRFNDSTINPVLSRVPGAGPCVRSTSFVSKVPPGDPMYEDAQAGALNFTLWLGTVNRSKVSKWNGVYNGQGGDISGTYVPPSDCDNFWLYL